MGDLDAGIEDLEDALRRAEEAGRPDVAERLVSSGDPQTLRDRLRLENARALLAEARSEPGAAEAYARVAERLRATAILSRRRWLSLATRG